MVHMPAKRKPDGLHFSADLALPIESVVETFAILGKRGSGKTSSAVVMAEEMIGAGQPVTIIDPLGVWWGLRSSKDGRSDGLPVVIFGGEHADVPLVETAGSIIADAIVAGRFPAILDTSSLSKRAMRRFMTTFFERLYERNREPLHLIVDEADLFAPQRIPAEGLPLFGALDDIQRRGRARGLGTTLITQRSAVLNKDLLSQAETLVVLRLTSARDVDAIDEWVKLHSTPEDAKEVRATLASQPVGTAWVWSPSFLEVLARVQVRDRYTFDSSATPKPGQPRPVAEAFSKVDVAALGAQIDALVEEAAASDVKTLQARVVKLERELAATHKQPPAARTEPETVEVLVEVPVLTETDRALIKELIEGGGQVVAHVTATLSKYSDSLASLQERVTQAVGKPAARPQPVAALTPAVASPQPTRSQPAPARPSGVSNQDGSLSKAARRILTALAQQGARSTNQTAILSGYSPTSGGYRNTLSVLRTNDLIEGRGTIQITQSGLDALGDYEVLPSGDELRRWWQGQKSIDKAARTILDVLANHYPHPVSMDDIAAEAGYSSTSGGFRNSVSRLRSLELASGRGELAINSELVG